MLGRVHIYRLFLSPMNCQINLYVPPQTKRFHSNGTPNRHLEYTALNFLPLPIRNPSVTYID